MTSIVKIQVHKLLNEAYNFILVHGRQVSEILTRGSCTGGKSREQKTQGVLIFWNYGR